MGYKYGSVHHLLPIAVLILAFWGIVFYVLMEKGIIKRPSFVPGGGPKVELKTEYKNPFDKETQYVNPFQEFKNPFNNL